MSLNRKKIRAPSLVLPLLLLGAAGHGVMVLAQSGGTFTATGNMTTARAGHAATLLPSGKVLIAGGGPGFSGPNPTFATAELYDPSIGTFAATGNMASAHECHQATLLGSGKVLIAGGSDLNGVGSPHAELYDPATGTFAAAGTYASDTSGFNTCQGAVSTLLPDGRVVIVSEEPPRNSMILTPVPSPLRAEPSLTGTTMACPRQLYS